jgi:uncharacterized membrane protein
MTDPNTPDPNAAQQPPAASEPQPQAQPPAQQPAPSTGDGLDPKIGAMLSYLLFGWIGGLIMFLTQKHPEVRFHAAQSIITFGGLTIISFALNFFIPVFGIGGLAILSLISFVVGLLSFILWIFLSIKGYNLEHFKLPVVGDMAEQMSGYQTAG